MLTGLLLSPGDEPIHDAEERGRAQLSPALQIPKNKSTSNLSVMGDSSEKARMRFSFDAGAAAAAAEYDTMTRLAYSSVPTVWGLGPQSGCQIVVIWATVRLPHHEQC